MFVELLIVVLAVVVVVVFVAVVLTVISKYYLVNMSKSISKNRSVVSE